MALSSENKKGRQTVVYPSSAEKLKIKKYAEKSSVSMSKIFIEGAKLYMKMHPAS